MKKLTKEGTDDKTISDLLKKWLVEKMNSDGKRKESVEAPVYNSIGL